jgi:hypothetical protein
MMQELFILTVIQSMSSNPFCDRKTFARKEIRHNSFLGNPGDPSLERIETSCIEYKVKDLDVFVQACQKSRIST